MLIQRDASSPAHYSATRPDGTTVGSTDKARLIRYLRKEGFTTFEYQPWPLTRKMGGDLTSNWRW